MRLPGQTVMPTGRARPDAAAKYLEKQEKYHSFPVDKPFGNLNA
jgi:hypothetical protein